MLYASCLLVSGGKRENCEIYDNVLATLTLYIYSAVAPEAWDFANPLDLLVNLDRGLSQEAVPESGPRKAPR